MTMRSAFCLSGIAVVLVVCACSPELSKRYGSASFAELDPTSPPGGVLFSVFTRSVPETSTVQTIASLAAQGQAEAVKAVAPAAKQVSITAFLASLVQPLKPPAAELAAVVETSKSRRRIVVNIVDQPDRPADRIEKAMVTLYIPPDEQGRLPARFLSWEAFSNRYETIDYGTVKLNRQISATADIKTGPIPSREIGEIGGTTTASRSLEEERKFSRKFTQSTAVLQEDRAFIPLKGAEGLDITTDSIALDVDVEINRSQRVPIKVFSFTDLYRGERPVAPDKVTVREHEWRLPGAGQVPVPLCARLDYILRTVISGDKTVMEGDNRVVFSRRSQGPVAAILVPPVEFATYVLGHKDSGVAVTIVTRDGRHEPLQLGDFNAASELRGWLTSAYAREPGSTAVTIGNRRLLRAQKSLEVRDLSQLTVAAAARAPQDSLPLNACPPLRASAPSPVG